MAIFTHEDDQKFKMNFVSTFLATWCANEYTNVCMRGEQVRLNTPPVEDAEFLAEQAWAHYCGIHSL